MYANEFIQDAQNHFYKQNVTASSSHIQIGGKSINIKEKNYFKFSKTSSEKCVFNLSHSPSVTLIK